MPTTGLGRWEAFPELWTFVPSTALGQQEAPGSMWLWVGIPSCHPSRLMLIIKPASRLPPSLPPSLLCLTPTTTGSSTSEGNAASLDFGWSLRHPCLLKQEVHHHHLQASPCSRNGRELQDSACLPNASTEEAGRSKGHRFEAFGSGGCCLGLCPRPWVPPSEHLLESLWACPGLPAL